MTTATLRSASRKVTVSQGNGSRAMDQAAAVAEAAMASTEVTADDVRAKVESDLKAALDAALATPRDQLAEPLNWWEIYGYGPIQPGAQLVPSGTFLSSPLEPGRIIRAGEKAYLVAVMIINPFPLPQDPKVVPVGFLTPWKLPYEIEYHIVNATNCTPVGTYKHSGHLVPGLPYYVDVLEIQPTEEGCIYEANICARILDCERSHPSPSPFAAFARSTFNLDPELFFPTQWLEFDNPIRFMVYE